MTTDQSRTSTQKSLFPTGEYTCSQGLPGGPEPYNSPDVPKTCESLQVPVPAKVFPQQASVRDLKTIGIYGRICQGSSESYAFQLSLANRCQVRLPMGGGTEYALNWRKQITPAGRVYYQLAASGRRTSGAGSSGLASDGWPTPTHRGDDWSPNAQATSSGGHMLGAACQLAGWATASSRDWKDTPGMSATGTNPDGSERERLDQLPRQVTGLMPSPSSAGTEKPGESLRLNPMFSQFLMGYPVSWSIAGYKASLKLKGR